MRILHRMTFSQPALRQVRQLIERSTDAGKTWAIDFDGLYQRRPPSPQAP